MPCRHQFIQQCYRWHYQFGFIDVWALLNDDYLSNIVVDPHILSGFEVRKKNNTFVDNNEYKIVKKSNT